MAGQGRGRQPAGWPDDPNPGASDVEQLNRQIEFLTQTVAELEASRSVEEDEGLDSDCAKPFYGRAALLGISLKSGIQYYHMLILHSIGLKIEPLSASTIEIICGQNSNSVLDLAPIPNPSIVNKRADYIKSIHEEQKKCRKGLKMAI